jgi:hypothetical protein
MIKYAHPLVILIAEPTFWAVLMIEMDQMPTMRAG